ncbi:PREDICTED: astacin-like metalloendopeptidase [Nanorana parkeri]|uniref:astacin-like metalloendopeptidase n=1 Tax=Nanorana parkeri TaxID=125878 RepID=UPI0008547907|nr:PREDICTED: astacin-like metalloendopeptidase [Nanorana parkeri]
MSSRIPTLILLQFGQFVCLSGKCNAKINVYDGVSKNSTLLVTVNAGQPLPVLISSDKFMLLEYIADTPSPSSFNASYKTESSAKCTNDYLTVRDGGNLTAPALGVYCGHKSNFIVTSSGPMVVLQFSSNSKVQGHGFHVDYSFGAEDTTSNDDDMTISDIILQANEDVPGVRLEGDIKPLLGRNAMKCKSCFWGKSKQGLAIVPYVISSNYSEYSKYSITSAMLEFSTMTCVLFTERTKEPNYLSFETGKGCWSYIGKINGAQTVNLDPKSCMGYGVIQHELMHSLGFFHEHNRMDRDNYVDIKWQYISPGNQGDFTKNNGNTMNLAYDYTSVMHYGSKTFSNTSGQMSIVPKPNPDIAIGQRIGLDSRDVEKINAIYNCNLCRKKLLGPSGNFSSTDVTPINNNDNCLWLLHVPSDLILLQFGQFVCLSGKCNAKINVYDGVSKNSTLLVTVNAGQPLPVLISSDKFMLLEYIADTPSPSSFNASYKTVVYGGTFTKNRDYVESPDYPFNYYNNLQAIYVIIAPPGNRVLLNFTDFDLESSTKCMNDYLTVRDGGNLTAPALGVYCGHKSNFIVTSSGPMVVLQFSSNSKVQGHGFHVDYSFG